MRGNGTSSPHADRKVQISMMFANGNVCLDGSGEQNTRILRSDSTFAEVAHPIRKVSGKSYAMFHLRHASNSVKVCILIQMV